MAIHDLAPDARMPPEPPSLLTVVSSLIERLESGSLTAGYQVSIRRGSAQGTVAVVPSPEDSVVPLLVVTLEIMRTPIEARDQFLTRLLELNGSLMGRASFSITPDGVVHLQAGRPIEDLDAGELIDLIVWTSDQADRLDDLLLEEFGREHDI